MESVLIDIVKALGSVFSAVFGIYGIGAKTRNEDDTLTRAGKQAAIGIIISLIVTICAQILDDRQSKQKSAAEAIRYQALLNDVFYDPLSTEKVTLDMEFSITTDQLSKIEPSYAKRLQDAFTNQSKCKVTYEQNGANTDSLYDCKGYKVSDGPLMGKDLTFGSDSPLAPTDHEKLALNAFKYTGLVFDVHSKNEKESDRVFGHRNPVFNFGQFWPQTMFRLDQFGLNISVHHERLPPDLLANGNVSSLIDLLGGHVDLDTHLIVYHDICSGVSRDSEACVALRNLVGGGAKLSEFELTFPHRRRIEYNDNVMKHGGVTCSPTETLDRHKEKFTVYRCPVPDDVAQITPLTRD